MLALVVWSHSSSHVAGQQGQSPAEQPLEHLLIAGDYMWRAANVVSVFPTSNSSMFIFAADHRVEHTAEEPLQQYGRRLTEGQCAGDDVCGVLLHHANL